MRQDKYVSKQATHKRAHLWKHTYAHKHTYVQVRAHRGSHGAAPTKPIHIAQPKRSDNIKNAPFVAMPGAPNVANLVTRKPQDAALARYVLQILHIEGKRLRPAVRAPLIPSFLTPHRVASDRPIRSSSVTTEKISSSIKTSALSARPVLRTMDPTGLSSLVLRSSR